MLTPVSIDLFFSDPKQWWCGPIRWATDGLWPHTGIIFNMNDNSRELFEAVVGDGVVLNPVKRIRDIAKKPKTRVVVVRLDPVVFGHTTEQTLQSYLFARGSVGKSSYSVGQLAAMLLFESFGVPVKKSKNKVVCSEFVARAMIAGKLFDPCSVRNPTPDSVSPDSLWRRFVDHQGHVQQFTGVHSKGMSPLDVALADRWM